MTASRTRVPIAVGALAAGALLLAGCGAASGPQQSERGSESFGGVSRVEVTAGSGSIQVRSGADGSSQVDRFLTWNGDARPRVTQEVAGDVLRVDARCADDEDCDTELVITVPAASSVRADLGAGNVTVTGLTGAHELSTGAGDVSGTGLGAAPVTARTPAGNVDLGFGAAPPVVDAESTAGDVTVRLPVEAVYEVDATTAAGTARIEVSDTPGADSRIRARSTAGNVSVLPG